MSTILIDRRTAVLLGELAARPDAAPTAVAAAAHVGVDVGAIANSLVFATPDDEPVLVMTSGAHRVDTAKVAALLGVPTEGRYPALDLTPQRQKQLTLAALVEQLEGLANGMEGVEQSYALQAGREIRVIANTALVDDARIDLLANDLARRIESEMDYPGKIKVTVIREIRAQEVAR